MRLDDHAVERCDDCRNRVIVCRGNGLRVEEAARVVQLQLTNRRQPRERVPNLTGDHSFRDHVVERVDPEVAHDAAERALPVGQEDGRGGTSAPALSRSSSQIAA